MEILAPSILSLELDPVAAVVLTLLWFVLRKVLAKAEFALLDLALMKKLFVMTTTLVLTILAIR